MSTTTQMEGTELAAKIGVLQAIAEHLGLDGAGILEDIEPTVEALDWSPGDEPGLIAVDVLVTIGQHAVAGDVCLTREPWNDRDNRYAWASGGCALDAWVCPDLLPLCERLPQLVAELEASAAQFVALVSGEES